MPFRETLPGTRNRRSIKAGAELSQDADQLLEKMTETLKDISSMITSEQTAIEKSFWSTATPTYDEKTAVRKSLLGQTLTPAETAALHGTPIAQDAFYQRLEGLNGLSDVINGGIKDGDAQAHLKLRGLSTRVGNLSSPEAKVQELNGFLSDSLDTVRALASDPFKLRRRAVERVRDPKAAETPSLYTLVRFCDEFARYMKKSGRIAGGNGSILFDVGQVTVTARDIITQRSFLMDIADNIDLASVRADINKLETNLAGAQAVINALASVGKNGVTIDSAAAKLGQLTPEKVAELGLSKITETAMVIDELEREALISMMQKQEGLLEKRIEKALMYVKYGENSNVHDEKIIYGKDYMSMVYLKSSLLDPLNNERIKFLAMAQVYMSVVDGDGKKELIAMNEAIENKMKEFNGLQPKGLGQKLNINQVSLHPTPINGTVGQKIYTEAYQAIMTEALAGATADAATVMSALGATINTILTGLSPGVANEMIEDLLNHQRNKDALVAVLRAQKAAELYSPTSVGLVS